ncbi:MAG: hypothetical protein QM758_07390 [Armatimonas sp.]
MNKNVLEIVHIIERCPSWADAAFHIRRDDAKKKQILNNLLAISKYPITDIEKAIIEYIKKKDLPGGGNLSNYSVSEMAKIFILNRYLFNVPETIPMKKHNNFLGFYGMPYNDQTIGLMWPLGFDKKGDLIILDAACFYNGPRYMGIEEFRYFKSLYGLRKRKPPERQNRA